MTDTEPVGDRYLHSEVHQNNPGNSVTIRFFTKGRSGETTVNLTAPHARELVRQILDLVKPPLNEAERRKMREVIDRDRNLT